MLKELLNEQKRDFEQSQEDLENNVSINDDNPSFEKIKMNASHYRSQKIGKIPF